MNPAEYLEERACAVLKHAIDAEKDGLKAYQSLRNLNEVIGTEYGDRVLYEMIQNAHDAHGARDKGRIAVELVIHSEHEGILYIANGGKGFRKKDVDAICNIAMSAKEIGEGIGNKGLGFRSIEALTDDVQIFSREDTRSKNGFGGFCFRFARIDEIEELLQFCGCDQKTSEKVARAVPRYLVPRPLKRQPEEITGFARRGYATVIVAPLRTPEAVALASREVEALAELDVPLLLFLDRIADFRIDIKKPEQKPCRRRLRRQREILTDIPSLSDTRIDEVRLGKERNFLVVRRKLDMERVRSAVERSILTAPQLERWLEWKEDTAVVSVAVGLSTAEVEIGRLYNYLPMGEEAKSPFAGYLDAPFFTSIDRRNADLNIPLNQMLMEAAAETCAAAALSIVEHNISIPAQAQAVFDLFAWTGEHAKKLDDALVSADSSLGGASVIPVIAPKGKKAWSNLSEVSIWPHGSFSLLKDREIAKHVGAKLVSNELDGERSERLKRIALRIYRQQLTPSGERLAKWSEIFARSLEERKMAPSTWSKFYKDLPLVFESSGANLEDLNGKFIFHDRTGKLHSAGGHGEEGQSGVFISDIPKRKRKKAGIPLPPSVLSRRYCFLDEKIKLGHGTLETFTEADLIRRYDPIEALAVLKSVLGEDASEKQRQEALGWAFQLWRATNINRDKLLEAGLYVPTLSGWCPAEQAAFSSSWTKNGKILEDYLTEAGEFSADCRQAQNLLLIGQEKWPVSVQNTKKDWVRFIELIGVTDGLIPVKARLTRENPGWQWTRILQDGEVTEALDADWCAEVKMIHTHCKHPNTEYTMKGEAWRMPGQIEHDKLPKNAREAFCTLVFEHLRICHGDCLQFEIGRFDRRHESQQDRKKLPTPLATFLRSRAWISTTTSKQQEIVFRSPRECWASSGGRGNPPEFVDRVLESSGKFAEDGELANLVFDDLKLRDWQRPSTAADRLHELANVFTTLSSGDRPRWRREYIRGWQEVLEDQLSLPDSLSLSITRLGKHEVLNGSSSAPEDIIITDKTQESERQALSSVNQAVLAMEMEPEETNKVAELLEQTGSYIPLRLEEDRVRFLIDGRPFYPGSDHSDGSNLTSVGLDWLPTIIVIGHEILGEELERGIQRETIYRKAREIRVRRCESMMLAIENERVPLINESNNCYALAHEKSPTLILRSDLYLDWGTLAYSLSRRISHLIDRRLRSLEKVLLRLNARYSEELDEPNDQALAEALECDVQKVSDLRAELRTDMERVQNLLPPIIAYYDDIDLGLKFRTDVERIRGKTDARKRVIEWLTLHFPDKKGLAKKLIEACEQAANLSELRRILNLDYEKFNRILSNLSYQPLSNETELRRLYDTHLQAPSMREKIIERLRRHHVTDFREGKDLALYVERKSLKFLEFDENWILTKETLGREVVEAHVCKLLTETLGNDRPEELEPLERVLEKNCKTVREFAKRTIPLIHAWCRQNDVSLPVPWQEEKILDVVNHIVDTGLLDFQVVQQNEMLELCRLADCWPEQMPLTLDEKKLSLNRRAVETEARHRKDVRRQQDIQRRTIQFAGKMLDTGDPDFSDRFQELANDCLKRDETWFERSRQRTRLIEVGPSNPSSRSLSNGSEGRGNNRSPGEPARELRQAMGLASEWLAFRFLRRRHASFFNQDCWVSRNRSLFLGGSEGDDTMGFDFRVNTPQAEWLYEVKSSLEDSREFVLTANEIRVASSAAKDGRRRYRILYVPYVFSPDEWFVLTLPNPMGENTRDRFKMVGEGSVRFRFERQ